MPNQEKIVIIGYGWVGQANALALTRLGYPVSYYDITPPVHRYAENYKDLYKQVKSLSQPLEKDSDNTWYIVCVGDGVNPDGKQDLSLITKALSGLKSAKGKVILRSTVLPQSLKDLPFDFYVPEFLHEKQAVEECLNPFYFVVGQRNKLVSEPSFLAAWRIRSRKIFKGTPEQASYIKYLSNIWNAVRIAFINEFGSLIQEPVDQRSMLEIEQVIDFIFEKKNYLRYGKAFGGHCLPKDLLAFYSIHKDKDIRLLRNAFESNELHRKKELNYRYLPQWFSGWDDDRKLIADMGWAAFFWAKLNSWQLVKATRIKLRFVMLAITRLVPNRSLERVREIWNDRARSNARYFVNTKHSKGKDVNEFDLRDSGEADYEKYVASDPLLTRIVKDHPGKPYALEIGCGIGRMTEFFLKDFAEVQGVDISDVMLESAQKRLKEQPRIKFALTDGQKLNLGDNACHFIFSYQTFQHLPTKNSLEQSLKEVYRVLCQGGMAKIHLRTGRGPYKWHWAYGVSVTPAEIKELAENTGFRFLNHQVEDVKSFWVWLEK